MPHFDRLEGPALRAYLLLRRQMMLEAARVNNLTPETAWDITIPGPEAVTYENLLPGPEAALKIIDLEPEHLGITVNSTTEQGYKYSLSVGENTEQVSHTIESGRVVGIHGIHVHERNPTPYAQTTAFATAALVQIDVNIGGREARVWPVLPVYDVPTNELHFLDPILVTEAKTIKIDLWAATASDVRLSWLGLYCKPKE